MYRLLDRRLALIENSGYADLLREGRKGVETETLRVTHDNRLAQTPHPEALGATLTHPYITTDFSESQLELVTPPLADAHEVWRFQMDLRRHINTHLEGELLWSTSMPCIVSGEESVPIARFGRSNAGRMKHVYRCGLAARYRRIMQIICGVHYNYSVADAFWPVYQELARDPQPRQSFISDAYFALARNAQRYDWLITYLFGCSPALCKSFMGALGHSYPEHDSHTIFEPYATSLRLSNLGYKNQEPALLNVSYDSLESYVATLYHATRTPYPPYEAFGIFADGEYQQLNASLLQIENEFYGSLRPKRVPQRGQRPLAALAHEGVQYVELRSLDVNAFEPVGVNVEQMRFLETFLLFCLLQESPPLDIRERAEAVENQTRVAHHGREPGLRLYRNGQEITLIEWAATTLDRIADVAALLDRNSPDHPVADAVGLLQESIFDPDRTPSARVLREMDQRNETFFEFARRLAEEHQARFERKALDPSMRQFLAEVADESRRLQAEIETQDHETFETYLARYFGQAVSVQPHHETRETADERE